MSKNKSLILGIATFSILLVLSALFYKERTVFLDISFHLFSILKDDGFAIQNNRFGAFFTQLFPLIGSKLGFSLTTLAISYSMSFVILPFLTFLFIHLYLKNTKVSVVYLVFSMIMTTHTFYWIQSELPQAIAFLFVFVALWDNSKEGKSMSTYALFPWSILLFTVCFTHPLILIIFSFLLAYYFINYPSKRSMTIPVGLAFYTFYIIKSNFFKTHYDSQALEGLSNLFTLLPKFHDLQSTKNLLRYFVYDYYMVAILFIVTVGSFIRERRYINALLIFSFFVGHCLLVNLSYPNGADQFYIENLYLVLAVIVAIPFVYDVLPKIKNPGMQLAFIGLICIIGVVRIIKTQSFYGERLEWYSEMLSSTESLPNKKLIIPISDVPMEKLLMTWGSSYEFWLLSTMESGKSRALIIEDIPGEFNLDTLTASSFLTKWAGAFDYSVLNDKYFIFTDTTEYVRLH